MASRTRVSFFLDDVGPYVTGVPGREKELCPVEGGALIEVLEYLKDRGIAGAISVIPGWAGSLLTRPKNEHERRFAEVVGTFAGYPVDPHMEIMTHGAFFDFAGMAPAAGDVTERSWLDDHSVPVQACRDYFLGTIEAGRELGIDYTGLSTPGTHPEMNPNVWAALLDLAEAGEFPNKVIPTFATIEEGPDSMAPRPKASRGDCAVYDMPSGVWDHFASWRNSPDWVCVDHYLNERGDGHLAAMIKAESPVALFHMHWQGFNPQTGLGWKAFQKMIDRLTDRFADRIAWRKPSEIASEFHNQQLT